MMKFNFLHKILWLGSVRLSNYDTKTITENDIHNIAFNQLANILDSTGHLYNSKRDSNNNQQLSKLAKSLFQLLGKKALKLSSFYAVPKMHKSPVVGRPIVASINSTTYHASKYIHNKLYPIMKKLNTICQSSREVIKAVVTLEKLPQGASILCADVKNLYPSIPIDYGMKAVETILHRYQLSFAPDETDHILKILYKLYI